MMAKKRRAGLGAVASMAPTQTKYDINETFNDSEDEFYAGRDEILLNEEPASKRQRILAQREQDLQPSDEEVLGHESEEVDVDDDWQGSDNLEDGRNEEEEEEQWGTTKADYYNADQIETEADALEEEVEARRLQQKQFKSMTMADFGVDESWMMDSSTTSGRPVVEKLPEMKIPANAEQADKLKILSSRYPEFEPLARDFLDLQKLWHDFYQFDSKDQATGITASTKLRALSTYLGAIAMYFAVLCSTARSTTDELQITALSPADLRDHAVVNNLVRSRQLWDSVKSTEIAKVPMQEALIIAEHPIKSQDEGKKPLAVQVPSPRIKKPTKVEEAKSSKAKSRGKTKLLDLQTLLAQPAELRDVSDFGDEDPLTEEQVAEKAKRKKSLRFYTSQIAQKANRRGAASRDAGGDDDVPHKERMRDRQERLLKEAEKRGQQRATEQEQLGDDEDGSVDIGDGNDYYQSMVAKSQKKKADKQARADAYAEATRQGGQVYEEEVIGTDGKRAITYAIEKNKGLMPRRKKDVRNPRVKKRKKYDEKKKKLGSMRQVYKGGEGRGGYGGELTGIKTNVVKSVKL